MTLSCQVSGVPTPTVSWIKSGGQRYNGHMLEVKHINRTQRGKYKCEASNECGNATKTATINVQCKLSCKSYPLLHVISCSSLSKFITLLLCKFFAGEACLFVALASASERGRSLATL